jgi:hypothetical protein
MQETLVFQAFFACRTCRVMYVSQQSITRCVFSRSGRGERLRYKSAAPEKKPETSIRTAVAALYFPKCFVCNAMAA